MVLEIQKARQRAIRQACRRLSAPPSSGFRQQFSGDRAFPEWLYDLRRGEILAYDGDTASWRQLTGAAV